MFILPLASTATGIIGAAAAFVVIAVILYAAMEIMIRRADRRYDRSSGDARRKHFG